MGKTHRGTYIFIHNLVEFGGYLGMKRTLHLALLGMLVLATLLAFSCANPAGSSDDDDSGTTLSTDATLSALTISQGTLSPDFAAATEAYTVAVENSVASVTVTPTANNSEASITVNSGTVSSGSASSAIALSEGSNTITIIVTAADGSTKKTYTITATRAAAPVVAWSDLPHGVSEAITANLGMVVDSTGVVYSMYRDAAGAVKVLKIADAAMDITPAGLVSGSAGLIALDPSDSRPIIMTMTGTGFSYPVVRKYDGSAWAEYDSAGLEGIYTGQNISGSSTYKDMVVGSNGNVYLAHMTYSTNNSFEDKAFVVMWDGSAWSIIGFLPDNTTTSNVVEQDIRLAVDSNNNVYIGFLRDGSSENNYATVYKWDGGTTTIWSQVGSPLSTAQSQGFDFVIDGDDTLWAISKYDPSGDNQYELYPYTYSGSAWTVEGGDISGYIYQNFVLIANGNQPMAAYADESTSDDSIVFKIYNGSSWVEAAPSIYLDTYNTLGDAQIFTCIAGGKLYVSYSEKPLTTFQLKIKSYTLD